MGKACDIVTELKPVLLMVLVQVIFAGVNVVVKLAIDDGMSIKVMTAYRFIFAVIFITPPALILERFSLLFSSPLPLKLAVESLQDHRAHSNVIDSKQEQQTETNVDSALPRVPLRVVFYRGSLTQNIYMETILLTSATFASAMCNLIPAVIFVLATSLGMEKLGLRTAAGKAKIVGTLAGIGGAMVLTLYKGPEINLWSTHVDLLKHREAGHLGRTTSHGNISVLGAILAVASCFGYASYLIVLAKMAEAYPCPYSCTALMSIMAAVQSVPYALWAEKDWDQWRLGLDMRLLAVAFLGISICVIVALNTWCVRARGPVFVSAFNPLTSVLVALAGSLVLEERLHLGSILGATSIVCGLYIVLWGKSEDMKNMSPPISVSTQEGAELIGITTATDGDFMTKKLHGNK